MGKSLEFGPKNTGFSKAEMLSNFVRASLLCVLAAGCVPLATYQKSLERERWCVADMAKSAEKVDKIFKPEELPERIEMTEIEGDPKVGTVVFIRQVHESPFKSISDEQEKKDIEKVSKYQAWILSELGELKPDALVPEGYDGGFKLGEQACEDEDTSDSETEENDLSDDERDLLKQMLYKRGAGLMYSEFNCPNPESIPGEIPELEDRKKQILSRLEKFAKIMEKYMSDPKSLSGSDLRRLYDAFIEYEKFEPEFQEVIEVKREQKVTERVMDYLKKNPGKTVAIIYGLAHNFCDDFNKFKNPPVLKSVYFPRLTDNDSESILDLMTPCK